MSMSAAAQRVTLLAAGLAALIVLVCSDVLGWGLSGMSAGALGALSGGALGILVPSPHQQTELVAVLREGAKAIAASQEPRAAESNESLLK